MTAAEVLAGLRARGVEVWLAGANRIRLRPADRVTPAEVEMLHALKPAALALLAAEAGPTEPVAPGSDADSALPAAEVARLTAMPLDVFASEGQPLEVRVPWWPATLFLVPDVRHAQALWREGIGRERVWTAGEVSSLLPAAPAPAQWRLLTVARREFGGEVVAVLPRDTEKTQG